MQKSRIRIWELALLLAVCVALCEASLDAARTQEMSEKIIRFHVIAESDEPEAQARKLEVRDAVLPLLTELLERAQHPGEAAELIEENRDVILAAAENAAGNRRVELVFGRESYGYRQTENCALPAGEYNSLRLIIGEGGGHNWWGVIFPQLDASTRYSEAVKILGDDGLSLLFEEEGTQLRFRFLEMLEQLRLWLKG
ncbi:MAG: stage II sporulation protein R [Oscillospiraceae bacterium]|nr:stage II sporulation protein R [Oscillospiraceae bacterium]